MKPPNSGGKTGPRPQPRQTWVSHQKVSKELREHDCSVIGLLAELAKDKSVDPALRFRATERLASLLYLPSDPAARAAAGTKKSAKESAPTVDIGAAIARNWAKDE